VKNKVFFFADYQGVRSDGSSPVTGVIVPDEAFRSGDLSALCTAGFDAGGICGNSAQQIRYPGTATPVPFNRIPASTINPVSQNFLAVWRDLSFTQPFDNSLNRVNARVDYQVSASDQVFGVLHRQWARYISYPGNLVVGPEGEQIGRASDYSLTAGWTRTFTPALLNSLRFGYMHRIGHRTNLGQGFTSPADFGLSGIPACLSSVPDTAGGQKCGTPGVSVSGFQSFDTGGILYEPANTLQISDSVTTLVGRHSVKVGGEARHYAIDNYQPNALRMPLPAARPILCGAVSDPLLQTAPNARAAPRTSASSRVDGAFFVGDVVADHLRGVFRLEAVRHQHRSLPRPLDVLHLLAGLVAEHVGVRWMIFTGDRRLANGAYFRRSSWRPQL
jgi:hypothetical protein